MTDTSVRLYVSSLPFAQTQNHDDVSKQVARGCLEVQFLMVSFSFFFLFYIE